jgi:hypothetical protein
MAPTVYTAIIDIGELYAALCPDVFVTRIEAKQGIDIASNQAGAAVTGSGYETRDGRVARVRAVGWNLSPSLASRCLLPEPRVVILLRAVAGTRWLSIPSLPTMSFRQLAHTCSSSEPPVVSELGIAHEQAGASQGSELLLASFFTFVVRRRDREVFGRR